MISNHFIFLNFDKPEAIIIFATTIFAIFANHIIKLLYLAKEFV